METSEKTLKTVIMVKKKWYSKQKWPKMYGEVEKRGGGCLEQLIMVKVCSNVRKRL